MSIGSRTEQCGTVLAGVKAKPFGWPSASPDPGCGRRQRARTGSPIPQITSLRFQGIARPPPLPSCLCARAGVGKPEYPSACHW